MDIITTTCKLNIKPHSQIYVMGTPILFDLCYCNYVNGKQYCFPVLIFSKVLPVVNISWSGKFKALTSLQFFHTQLQILTI